MIAARNAYITAVKMLSISSKYPCNTMQKTVTYPTSEDSDPSMYTAVTCKSNWKCSRALDMKIRFTKILYVSTLLQG